MPRAWYTTDKTRSVTRRLAAFFGVIVVLWGLSFLSFLAPIYHGAQGTLYAVSSWIGRAGARLFANEDSLSSQLTVCTNRLTIAAVQAATAEANAREAEEWRSLVGYVQRTNTQGIPARIIARSSPTTSQVVIDRGTNDGIAVASAVVIGDGVLYGTIESATSTSSIVRLTEDVQSAVAGSILGKNKTIGIVNGQEGALLAMDFIPQDTLLTLGDVVVTSGLDGEIPEGLVIGTVTEIIATPSAPFIRAAIAPVHDPREWTSVFVLLPMAP
jgi:rod shape-determining protein MreC